MEFRYNPQSPHAVIHHFSLHIPAGQVLAIVGPTGHGKSTLVQLLTRLYEVQGGSVKVDGQDVRHYAQHALRNKVGIVLQDNVLFAGSVLDNLRLAAPHADDDTLIAAARALGADRIVYSGEEDEKLIESVDDVVGQFHRLVQPLPFRERLVVGRLKGDASGVAVDEFPIRSEIGEVTRELPIDHDVLPEIFLLQMRDHAGIG